MESFYTLVYCMLLYFLEKVNPLLVYAFTKVYMLLLYVFYNYEDPHLLICIINSFDGKLHLKIVFFLCFSIFGTSRKERDNEKIIY